MNDQENITLKPSTSLSGDSVGITIDIVLGSRTMTLAEISKMKAGYVMEWEGGSTSANIIVSGRIIGSGRIVTVGDHLGLVVESLIS